MSIGRLVQQLCVGVFGASLWGAVLSGGMADAQETPTSHGEVASIDTPILRVPYTEVSPQIDGVMEPGEWDDSSSLSGFWYDYAEESGSDFRFMAPRQTMPVVYACFDKKNLYVCYVTPVYPEGSLLKSLGRFPDTVFHPTYGILWDDHIEFELRPTEDNSIGFVWGLYKWIINPTNASADQHWSQNGGEGLGWSSKATIRSNVSATAWTLEMAIPLSSLIHGAYAERNESGQPRVTLPIADGTAYRAWFGRGIGGGCQYFNAFDKHDWYTTKTKLVFDSPAPSFQITDIGPVLDDMIDVRVTVKNRNIRSESVRAQTIRLGFFVENAAGMNVYSSYDAPELKDGLLELVPGETKQLRLRKSFPGINTDGNTLWFDVRTAGSPAITLFRTRLIDFHSINGGVAPMLTGELDSEGRRVSINATFKERRIDRIKGLRSAKQDFLFTYTHSLYRKCIVATIDKGLLTAPEGVKSATEVKVSLIKVMADDELPVQEARKAFEGAFAIVSLENLALDEGATYKLSALLFDADKRIVGERTCDEFVYKRPSYINNTIGLEDTVWEHFTDIRLTDNGFETVRQSFEIAPSGLPAQINIRPDPKRELPLEMRSGKIPVTAKALLEVGRGPQLRAPLRFEAVIGGRRIPAEVMTPAKATRIWKSEIEYTATLTAGALVFDLVTQYDCSGAMHCRFSYHADTAIMVDAMEMLMDVAGLVDLKLTSCDATGHRGMAGADVWDCSVPEGTGVVWDSGTNDSNGPELFYSCFIPYFWFGSADRGWTWFCDSDRSWSLPKKGSAMTLERNSQGEVTWRLKFFSQPKEVKESKEIAFSLLTHPQKFKPQNAPFHAWHSFGNPWDQYGVNYFKRSDETLMAEAKMQPQEPPYHGYYQMGSLYTPGWNRAGEDCFVEGFARNIRLGGKQGWWWDLAWPPQRSENLADDVAYIRNPADVTAQELPYQAGFTTRHMYNTMKRLARVSKTANVTLANSYWGSNSASLFEAFGRMAVLTEGCGCEVLSHDIDNLTNFPETLWRYLAHGNHTGLISILACPANLPKPGDDEYIERQLFGRALLNGIGFQPVNHGKPSNLEECLRILRVMTAFGLLNDDGQTEFIPYWRNRDSVQYGAAPQPANRGVYASVYRRPAIDGKGYRALIILVNEKEKLPSSETLFVNMQRLLGDAIPQTASAVWARRPIPESLKEWWANATAGAPQGSVLEDAESGALIHSNGTDTFGPVYVPWHDFRMLLVQGGER